MVKGWHGQKRRHSQASKKGWDKRKLYTATQKRTGLTIREGVSPDYYRPITREITDRTMFKKDFIATGGKKLYSGVYREIVKSKNSPTGYEMAIFTEKGGNLHSHIICNKDGSIPDRQAILRVMDVESGSEAGRRSLFRDLSENADLKFKKDEKGNWKWYIKPNKSDLINIDTKEQDFSKSLKGLKREGQRKAQKGIVILARSQEEEIDMRKRIGQAFTQKEQKEMGLIFVSITKPSGSGSAGEYWHGSDPPQIYIDPKYNTSDTLIHELTHHHRAVSPSRKGALAHTTTYRGEDRDLEESMTEAEAVTREKPFDKIQGGAGYYHFLGKDTTEKNRSQIEDRKLLTKYQESKHGKLEKIDSKLSVSEKNIKSLGKKNIKGLRAIKTVRAKYPETNISKLKIKGRVEAVDTFHQYEKGNVKVKVQAYNPRLKPVKTPGHKSFKKNDLYEWRDGKKVKVR